MSHGNRVLQIVTLIVSVVAWAQAGATVQRTFVASNGNDLNPCSITLPCRAFSAAVAQTQPGGEVIVLDSAGYGPVNIAQSVSIIAPPGVYAGISVFAGNGVGMFSQPATTRVVLRGLTISSQGGLNGITMQFGGGILHIEDCVLEGFAAVGNSQAIYISNDAAAQVFISNTVVRGGRDGIGLSPQTGGTLAATLDHVRVAEMTGSAVFMFGEVHAQIRDSAFTSSSIGVNVGQSGDARLSVNIERSTISGNSSWGLYANLAGGSALARGDIAISESEVSDNGGGGVFVAGFTAIGTAEVKNSTLAGNGTFAAVQANPNGTIRIMGNSIVRNSAGWGTGGGTVLSLGNNMIEGNGAGNIAPPALTPK